MDTVQIRKEFFDAESEKAEVFDVMYKYFLDLLDEIERTEK